jgi:hypothetical protein
LANWLCFAECGSAADALADGVRGAEWGRYAREGGWALLSGRALGWLVIMLLLSSVLFSSPVYYSVGFVIVKYNLEIL